MVDEQPLCGYDTMKVRNIYFINMLSVYLFKFFFNSFNYRKSAIKPPGGLFFFQALLSGGGGA